MFDRKLPVGIQDFESLRKDGYLYVDKTAYIFHLVHEGKPYFLSRPRRFGKSLLLSALRAYWEGRRDLFEGLSIEELEHTYEKNASGYTAWQPYPVFYFDFNRANFQRTDALEDVLSEHLNQWESQYGIENGDKPLEERFRRLLEKAVEETGREAVVLVDEYDKPLLEVMTKPEIEEHNKAVFKGFFSTLNSYDHYLKFVFLTGVTKFGKVSIFSDLNQLIDISLSSRYAGICGITQEELENNFMPGIEAMAVARHITPEGCLARLKKMYDGYRFHDSAPGVYNPFSLLNAFLNVEFGAYWFSTGTPTFLIEKLKETGVDPKRFTDGSIYADAATLSDYRADNPDPVPLFFRSGYLTIKDYDEDFNSYELGYPNDEVKYGFLKSLAPLYLHDEKAQNPLDIRQFGLDIKKGNAAPYAADKRTLYRIGAAFDSKERALTEWVVR